MSEVVPRRKCLQLLVFVRVAQAVMRKLRPRAALADAREISVPVEPYEVIARMRSSRQLSCSRR
jgi:hypothetical protein